MIAARRLQRSFGDGLIAEEVADLWEPWMRQADQVLEDDGLVTLIQQELSKRCKKSKTRGRPSTPADVVLRLALLKHMRNWSFAVLAREVRANLVYREFTRIGGGACRRIPQPGADHNWQQSRRFQPFHDSLRRGGQPQHRSPGVMHQTSRCVE